MHRALFFTSTVGIRRIKSCTKSEATACDRSARATDSIFFPCLILKTVWGRVPVLEGTSIVGGLKGQEKNLKNLSTLGLSLNYFLHCIFMPLPATKVAVCCGRAKQRSDQR